MQTKRQIAAVLDGLGTHPKKRLGQHFLIDGNLMRRLVDSADLAPSDIVLEVGAGTGGLTDLLAERVAAVIAVEADTDLGGFLAQRFAAMPNVTLIVEDVLSKKSALAPAVTDAISRARRAAPNARLLLVANLPYSISSPLLVDLLLSGLGFRRLCFTVQKEVAHRILADPDTKEYGPLGVIIQAACRSEKIAAVPPQAFWPVPEVESVMLRLEVDPQRIERAGNLTSFAAIVREIFTMRRKTIGHVLHKRYGRDVAERVIAAIGLDPTRRSETLDISEWIQLTRAILAAT